MEKTFIKDATAVLDYAMDWSTWLGTAETISTYDISANTTIITISTYGVSTSYKSVTTWISGGTNKSDNVISIKIVTTSSRTDKRSFMVKIRER